MRRRRTPEEEEEEEEGCCYLPRDLRRCASGRCVCLHSLGFQPSQ